MDDNASNDEVLEATMGRMTGLGVVLALLSDLLKARA